MYFEHIAKLTAQHLNEHIAGYLAAIAQEFAGTEITSLDLPKAVRVDSVVGGVFTAELDELPVYAVDSQVKAEDPEDDNLYTYIYNGTIIGMDTALTSLEVDRKIKRHEWAVEKFVREHPWLHEAVAPHFRVIGFAFVGSSFSGAEQVIDDQDPTQIVWVDAFRIDVRWKISEDGPSEHD